MGKSDEFNDYFVIGGILMYAPDDLDELYTTLNGIEIAAAVIQHKIERIKAVNNARAGTTETSDPRVQSGHARVCVPAPNSTTTQSATGVVDNQEPRYLPTDPTRTAPTKGPHLD